MENGLTRCSGGYCEMCPVKIQLECEMTIKERVEHIRQCLRNMKPTMGFEIAAAEEIEKELAELELIVPAPSRCPICRCRYTGAMLEGMIRNSLNGDTCG